MAGGICGGRRRKERGWIPGLGLGREGAGGRRVGIDKAKEKSRGKVGGVRRARGDLWPVHER